jgi:hypothetical protein
MFLIDIETMSLNIDDKKRTDTNIRKNNYCGREFFIKRTMPKAGKHMHPQQECRYCPTNMEQQDRVVTGTGTDAVTVNDIYITYGAGMNSDTQYDGVYYRELSDERKDDLLMCGNLRDLPLKLDGKRILTDADDWKKKQIAHDMKGFKSHKFRSREEKSPLDRVVQPEEHLGTRDHGSDNFKRCVYGNLRIHDGNPDETLNILMNAPYRKIHSCLEETAVHKDCRDGYSQPLMELMGDLSRIDATRSSDTGQPDELSETEYKAKLAHRHLIHLAARMEHNDCGTVSEDTHSKKDMYDKSTFKVVFPKLNLMGFLDQLAGINPNPNDPSWISSVMRIAAFVVVSLALYMFTRLLLK